MSDLYQLVFSFVSYLVGAQYYEQYLFLVVDEAKTKYPTVWLGSSDGW
jgi:hypothetical protein